MLESSMSESLIFFKVLRSGGVDGDDVDGVEGCWSFSEVESTSSLFLFFPLFAASYFFDKFFGLFFESTMSGSVSIVLFLLGPEEEEEDEEMLEEDEEELEDEEDEEGALPPCFRIQVAISAVATT